MSNTETLTEEGQLVEVEARHAKADRIVDDHYVYEYAIAASLNDIPALCRSLRAAWADIAQLRCQYESAVSDFAVETNALRTQNQTHRESIIEFQENERSLKAQLKDAEFKIRQCENAFELQDAVRIPEVGKLNMLQIVRKLGEMQSKLAQVEQERQLCQQVQKRGEHSSVTCPCIVALKHNSQPENL